MKKNKTQFTINLIKTPEGYLFDSLIEENNLPIKSKKVKNSSLKNPPNRSLNRIAKELALNLQPPPIHEEQPSLPQDELSIPKNPPEYQIDEQISVENKRELDLPQCPTKWFDIDSIDSREKAHFPQFFNAKTYKTPQLYLKYRNFIYNLYKREPGCYLTKIACRRVLRGDAPTILKIHSFLEKHGLINYSVSFTGNFNFKPLNIRKDNPCNLYTQVEKIPEEEESKHLEQVQPMIITSTLICKNFSKTYRGWCEICKMLCGLVWYRGKNSERTLCVHCYHELPSDQTEQFIRWDIVKKAEEANVPREMNRSVWGIDENMKLLDFMEKDNDHWDALKQKTLENKRPLEDIILQSLQFPITNFQPTEQLESPALSGPISHYANSLMGKFRQSPYSRCEEEVISTTEPNKEQMTVIEQNNKMMELLCEKYDNKMSELAERESLLREADFGIDNTQLRKEIKREEEESQMKAPALRGDSSFNPHSEDESHSSKYEPVKQDSYNDDLDHFLNSLYD